MDVVYLALALACWLVAAGMAIGCSRLAPQVLP
jgi:hypothetical protein